MLVPSQALVRFVLMGALLFSGPVAAGEFLNVDVFTAVELPISGKADPRLRAATVTVYAVDGLTQFESALSHDLPTDADAAKPEALRRIGALTESRIALAKNAAMGLARAVQFGVDRYPAIVFNGTAVVFGVTDLAEAVQRYDAWREAQSR
jgi:integrating conjugative element protein (TIGR03757 family)